MENLITINEMEGDTVHDAYNQIHDFLDTLKFDGTVVITAMLLIIFHQYKDHPTLEEGVKFVEEASTWIDLYTTTMNSKPN